MPIWRSRSGQFEDSLYDTVEFQQRHCHRPWHQWIGNRWFVFDGRVGAKTWLHGLSTTARRILSGLDWRYWYLQLRWFLTQFQRSVVIFRYSKCSPVHSLQFNRSHEILTIRVRHQIRTEDQLKLPRPHTDIFRWTHSHD